VGLVVGSVLFLLFFPGVAVAFPRWRRRNKTGAEIEEEGCVFALVDVGFAAVFALLALPVGIFAFEFFALDSHQHPTWAYRVGTFLVTLGPLLALLSTVIVPWSRWWSNSAA
jgi:Kef-type K+ transport system membrane component KefB